MLSNDSGSRNSVTTVNSTVGSLRRRAEEGDGAAQFKYALLLAHGDG
jgi:TPR repeat protein